MFKDTLRQVAKWYIHKASLKTRQKILVIESDDWGSRRTDSRHVRAELNSISEKIKNDWYIQLDNLATSDDLIRLSETLQSVESNQNTPVLTANFCMANPDFEQIRKSNFEVFFYETFDKTLSKVHGKNVEMVWKNLIKDKIVRPQLHGREHLHALAWLKELQNENEELLKAFDLNSWGIPYSAKTKQRRKNCQAALDHYGFDGELDFQREWVKESTLLFEKYFGYKSSTFIAPTYIWHPEVGQVLIDSGIRAYQGIQFQDIPLTNGTKQYNRKLNLMGRKDRKGIVHLVRNAFFEPSSNPNYDWKSHCLNGISEAFKHNMPAIVGSHRVNYVGSLDEQNREKNLKQLKEILQKVVQNYPDVHFMSSDELLNNMLLNNTSKS